MGMVRKFESNDTTKNDVVIELVNILNSTETNLPVKQFKRYDGGFSIIMEDGKVFDVYVMDGEPYYY